MLEDGALAILLAVSLVGAALQAALGFGFAILAAPIFLAVTGKSAAIQVLAALHVVLSLIVVPSAARSAEPRLLGWLVSGSVLGFPAGLALFLALDVQLLKLLVGAATVLFTLPLVWREFSAPVVAAKVGPIAFRPLSAMIVGFLSGVLTAILVMPGPLAVLYIASLGLGKDESRGTGLTFFGLCYIATTTLHALWGGMDRAAWGAVGILAPAVVAGAVIGLVAVRHLSEKRFRRAVVGVLLASGVYVLLSALR